MNFQENDKVILCLKEGFKYSPDSILPCTETIVKVDKDGYVKITDCSSWFKPNGDECGQQSRRKIVPVKEYETQS